MNQCCDRQKSSQNSSQNSCIWIGYSVCFGVCILALVLIIIIQKYDIPVEKSTKCLISKYPADYLTKHYSFNDDISKYSEDLLTFYDVEQIFLDLVEKKEKFEIKFSVLKKMIHDFLDFPLDNNYKEKLINILNILYYSKILWIRYPDRDFSLDEYKKLIDLLDDKIIRNQIAN